jgi:hypothetical protein
MSLKHPGGYGAGISNLSGATERNVRDARRFVDEVRTMLVPAEQAAEAETEATKANESGFDRLMNASYEQAAEISVPLGVRRREEAIRHEAEIRARALGTEEKPEEEKPRLTYEQRVKGLAARFAEWSEERRNAVPSSPWYEGLSPRQQELVLDALAELGGFDLTEEPPDFEEEGDEDEEGEDE